MSEYFDYQNPPVGRDTLADLTRVQDHFERMAQLRRCDDSCNGCDECTNYECSCEEYLRPECEGVGCAAERANDRRREKERLMGGVL